MDNIEADRPVIPAGDPSHHLSAAALEPALRALQPPRDRGHVALLVARGPDHLRTTPARVRLEVGEPLPGDRWQLAKASSGDGSQLAVINVEVASAVANGQALTLSGDNLLLDLDLSVENLPVGSLLRVGDAELEVTPKAHTGCKQFAQRFGKDALRLTAAPEWQGARLRGLFLRVVRPGEVGVGDAVEVLRRGAG